MALIAPDILPEPVRPPRLQPEASVETFGGGPGLERENQEMQKIASATGEIETFEKIRADQTAVQDATDKLSRAHQEILYGKPDPANPTQMLPGVLTSQGKDALPAQEQGWKDYRKTANDIASGLMPDQQGAFRKIALSMGDQFNRQTMVHVDQQLKQHDTNTFNSLTDSLTNQAAMSYDPLAKMHSLDLLHSNLDAYVKRNGFNADEAKDMKSKIDSQFYGKGISQMLADKQDILAKQYFDQVKDQITDPNVKERIENELKEGTYRGESQRQSDNIWKQSDSNLQKAYGLADKVDDPELRDRIHQRLREKDNEVKEARKSDEDNAYYESSKIVGQAVKSGQVKGEQSLMDVVGPDRWTRMSPSQQEGVKRLYLNDQNSDQVWTNYNLMSPTDKASQSQSEFETDVLSRLDKSHRDKAMSMRNASLGNRVDSLTDHDQAKLIEKSAQISGIIPGLNPGIPASKLKGDAASTYGAFQDQLQESIANFEHNELGGRRRASQKEVQQIVDHHILDMLSNSKPAVFTSIGRTLGFTPTPAVKFGDIPDDAKENILIKARQLGKAVTKEQIESAYTAYQNKDLQGVLKALQ